MLDIHAHILPRMDDGSSSVAETVRMLRASAEQGITEIVATPHYYADKESPESFLQRRRAAFEELWPYLRREVGLPQVRLGAEVRYFEGMCGAERIRDLVIAGTRLMLVEMPFREWSQRMLQDLIVLQRNCGIRPILAHIERYPCFRNTKLLRRLRNDGVLLQVNAEVFYPFFSQRRAERLLKEGIVDFIASDCHNMTDREPNLEDGFDIFRQGCGNEFVNRWLVHGNII